MAYTQTLEKGYLPQGIITYVARIVDELKEAGEELTPKSILQRIYQDGATEIISSREFVNRMKNPSIASPVDVFKSFIHFAPKKRTFEEGIDLSTLERTADSCSLAGIFSKQLSYQLHPLERKLFLALEN